MSETPKVRLRQAVLVARELEPTAAELRVALGLAEPFRDPGVAEFGLANVVFALGDCFIEIVSPIKPETAAGRHLDRRGAGGYMALFDLQDLAAARERTRALGVRVVWQVDLPDISGTHLHPGDMRGAIVSLDRSAPYGTWRWGGPQWTGQTGSGAAGALAGITVAVADPAAVAGRWGEVLGVVTDGEAEQPSLVLEDAYVRFELAADAATEGISEIAVRTPAPLPAGAASIELGGVRLRRVDSATL